MEDISLAWNEKQKILVILAHPDDPEFFCGGTLSRWAKQGHIIDYVLLTCGDKGRNDFNHHIPGDELCRLRHKEQRNAGNVIGVRNISFLENEDGMLTSTLENRKSVVKQIRIHQPDILVTCDPQFLFTPWGVNHPDHRAAGQLVLDAVFPASGNELFFPELLAEGYQPHSPKEVWVSLTDNPNLVLDITDSWETKISALKEHTSQIGDFDPFYQRMKKRQEILDEQGNAHFYEKFRVINWR